MGAVLFAMIGPTVVFGLFALLAVRYGAESRPYFDERPVVDDRPNWFPIAGSGRGDDDEDDDEPHDGDPMPAAGQPESATGERAGADVVARDPVRDVDDPRVGRGPGDHAVAHADEVVVVAVVAEERQHPSHARESMHWRGRIIPRLRRGMGASRDG